jgi:transposase
MRVILPCCAGLDVHKKSVVTCVRTLGPDGHEGVEVRTFGTMTADLLALADWLEACGVTHVAMESTGVHWKPVVHILEGRFEAMVVDAGHIKNVPGRKTDVKDAEWIAELLQHGLLKPRFIPPPPIRALRDLTRQRAQLVRDRATVVNRIQKVLEGANIKLAGVATDVMGVSGRAMIRGLIAGGSDPGALAERARARLRQKLPQLREALDGRVTDHHRFQLRLLMEQVDHLEGWITALGDRIEAVMAPFAAAARRLARIPGVGQRAAEVIVAEVGTDMTKFPTAGHLAAWAGMRPGNKRTANKRLSGTTTQGSQWLPAVLVQVAWAASHTKETIVAAAYRRWVKRPGQKKALVAVAHRSLVVADMLLRDQTDYRELGTPAQAA